MLTPEKCITELIPVGATVRVTDSCDAFWVRGQEGPVVEHWDGMVGVRLGASQGIHWFAVPSSLAVIEEPLADWEKELLGGAPVEPEGDAVNFPTHYRSHPSGVECIDIVAHMNFPLGNVVKYSWRADLKHDDGGMEDLLKARQYLDFEIARRQGEPISAAAGR